MFTFSMEGLTSTDRAPFASAVCLGSGLELPAGVEQIPGTKWAAEAAALAISGCASV